jgi:hypothetical protein
MITKTPNPFVPYRLEVPNKPEYSHFPLNVLFVSFRNMDGRLQSGTALYEPNFDTYRKEGHLSSMRYHNIYSSECYLVVDYDEKDGRYRGEKFVNGKSAGSAYGGDNWQLFFTHFTMLGLVDGEGCKFEGVASPAFAETVRRKIFGGEEEELPPRPQLQCPKCAFKNDNPEHLAQHLIEAHSYSISKAWFLDERSSDCPADLI